MNTKLLVGIIALVVIVPLMFFINQAEAPTESEGEIVAVPLSGTDETMERNASNEQRFGVETSYQIPNGDGTMRDATASEIYQIEATDVELTFDHESPGEYSEVYGSVRGIPGEDVEVTLSGPGVMNTDTKVVTIGEDGYTTVTWRINQYGTYEASMTPYGIEFMGKTATVVVN